MRLTARIRMTRIYMNIYTHTYIYIYTHTLTHIYIYKHCVCICISMQVDVDNNGVLSSKEVKRMLKKEGSMAGSVKAFMRDWDADGVCMCVCVCDCCTVKCSAVQLVVWCGVMIYILTPTHTHTRTLTPIPTHLLTLPHLLTHTHTHPLSLTHTHTPPGRSDLLGRVPALHGQSAKDGGGAQDRRPVSACVSEGICMCEGECICM
jgi:hypothetical protein